jgi:hypothetical protein
MIHYWVRFKDKEDCWWFWIVYDPFAVLISNANTREQFLTKELSQDLYIELCENWKNDSFDPDTRHKIWDKGVINEV